MIHHHPFLKLHLKSSQEIDLRYHGGKTVEISIVNPRLEASRRVLRCIETQVHVGMFRPRREKFIGSRAELGSPRIVVRHATRYNATHARRFQAGIYYGHSRGRIHRDRWGFLKVDAKYRIVDRR